MTFPLMVSASGILVCMLTTLIATDLAPAKQISEIEHTLKMQLIISTVLMTPVSGTAGTGCSPEVLEQANRRALFSIPCKNTPGSVFTACLL